MATRQRTWRKVYDAPRGLRFFVQLIDGESIQRVAVADRSGSTPDMTDDGVLWVDLDRPWLVEDSRVSIPVKRDGGGRDLWTGESTNYLFDLLAALRKPDALGEEALRIRCELSGRGGTGARAILKCLALGVQP